MKYDIIFPTAFDSINPDNVKYLMKKDNVSFLKPGLPFLFVEKLTDTNIRMVVESLLEEDEQLIRIYGDDF